MSSFSGIPPQNVELVAGKTISIDWYRYLLEVYQWSGLAKSQFPLWQTLAVPGLSMVGGAEAPSLETLAGNLQAYSFGDVLEKALYFSLHLPTGYTPGTALVPFVSWAPSTSGTGSVRWSIEYTWANGETVLASPQTISASDVCDGAALKNQIATFEALSGNGKTYGSLLLCRVYRDTLDSSDTYASPAFLLSAGVRFQNSAHGTPKPTP